MKPKTIAILYESSAFGTSGADAMEKDAKKLGIKVVLKEKFETGAIDFKPLLSKVKAAQPDVVYTVSYANEAQLLMKQIKELRIDAKLYAGGAAGFAIPEFIEGAKDAAEYVVSATLWTPQLKYPGRKGVRRKVQGQIRRLSVLPRRIGLCRALRDRGRSEPGQGLDARTASATRSRQRTSRPPTARSSSRTRKATRTRTSTRPSRSRSRRASSRPIWPKTHASKPYVYPVPSWRDRK